MNTFESTINILIDYTFIYLNFSKLIFCSMILFIIISLYSLLSAIYNTVVAGNSYGNYG